MLDFTGIELEIDTVETDKTYDPPIENIAVKFDLYAEDKKNKIIVNIQHVRFPDHYHRFLHYHCAALLNKIVNAKDCLPPLKVITLVVLTSGDRHKKNISIIDFEPKDLQNNPLGKIIYICPKYMNRKTTPKDYQEWMAAIEDSLDGEVEESYYTCLEIQDVFDLIQKDNITPEERAKMFDEYGIEEIKKEKLKEFTAKNLLKLGNYSLLLSLPNFVWKTKQSFLAVCSQVKLRNKWSE